MVRIPLHQMKTLAGYRAAGLAGHIRADSAQSTLVSRDTARTVTPNAPEPQERRYVIIDTHTQQQIGSTYASRIRAQRRADALDLAYGAVRYFVRMKECA